MVRFRVVLLHHHLLLGVLAIFVYLHEILALLCKRYLLLSWLRRQFLHALGSLLWTALKVTSLILDTNMYRWRACHGDRCFYCCLHCHAKLLIILVSNLPDVVYLVGWQLHDCLHAELVVLLAKCHKHT